jgi:hypothetical protein
MQPIEVTIVDSKGFWENLASTAFWQVVLVLLTAFLTAYFTHFFIRRRVIEKKRTEALSDFRRYGYELQQVYSNRLQSDIFYYFYSAMFELTKNDEYHQHLKIQIDRMPELSIEFSKAYGRLYKSISLLEQLIKKDKMQKVSELVDTLINYKVFIVPKPPANADVDALREYRDHNTLVVARHIDKHIRNTVDDIYYKVK